MLLAVSTIDYVQSDGRPGVRIRLWHWACAKTVHQRGHGGYHIAINAFRIMCPAPGTACVKMSRTAPRAPNFTAGTLLIRRAGLLGKSHNNNQRQHGVPPPPDARCTRRVLRRGPRLVTVLAAGTRPELHHRGAMPRCCRNRQAVQRLQHRPHARATLLWLGSLRREGRHAAPQKVMRAGPIHEPLATGVPLL